MKLLNVFIIASVLLSCSQNEPELHEPLDLPQFNIDSAIYNVKYFPTGMIKFNKNIILHTHNNLEVYDSNMAIDSLMNASMQNSIPTVFDNVWLANDTIYLSNTKILERGERSGIWKALLTISYWTKQKSKWSVLKVRGITNEEWQMEEQMIPLFEDETYIVRAANRGEFGGSIYFVNKATRKVYSTDVSRVVGVHKVDGSYIVISSSGVPNMVILKIDDPEQMYNLTESQNKYDCTWHTIDLDSSPYYSKVDGYDKGIEILLDTFDVRAIGSFEYKKQLFQIYADHKKTYLGYLNAGQLTPIDTLLDMGVYYSGSRNMKQNSFFFPIISRNYTGFIDVKDNQIEINKFNQH